MLKDDKIGSLERGNYANEVKWAGIPAQRAVPPEGVDEDKPERE